MSKNLHQLFQVVPVWLERMYMCIKIYWLNSNYYRSTNRLEPCEEHPPRVKYIGQWVCYVGYNPLSRENLVKPKEFAPRVLDAHMEAKIPAEEIKVNMWL